MATTPRSESTVRTETVAAADFHNRVLTVDFLFLDRHSCDRCAETEEGLETAVDRVADLLADLGIGLHIRKTKVETSADAYRTGLQISPTIRIDGRDIQPEFEATTCESCTDIADCCDEDEEAIDCRSWSYRGRTFEVPPVEMVIEAILRHAVGTLSPGAGPVGQPSGSIENLEQFFDSTSEAGTENGEASGEDDSSCC